MLDVTLFKYHTLFNINERTFTETVEISFIIHLFTHEKHLFTFTAFDHLQSERFSMLQIMNMTMFFELN